MAQVFHSTKDRTSMSTLDGPLFAASPPADTYDGPKGCLLMVMEGLGTQPVSGRLLRGLTPFLDERKAKDVFLFTERKRTETWLSGKPSVPYQELVHWARDNAAGVYRGVSWKGPQIEVSELVELFQQNPKSLVEDLAKKYGAAIISSVQPLRLEACEIKKPWGQEIWYTGVESRGVSRVVTSHGATEIPYALGMFPVPLIGESEPDPILFKILDPLPEEVFGDLYLEVHREKWETYLVLSIDKKAWPDGVGYLRAGLNAKEIEKWKKKQEGVPGLVEELKARIEEYEGTRREIDDRLDKALGAKAKGGEWSREVQQAQLNKMPAKLTEKEQRQRRSVEALLGRIPLKKGDVVVLPPGVLHSLQHGVKVAEFQTATYERLIAMFSQKVLTQTHWDTAAALETMSTEPYQVPELTALPEDQSGVTRHLLVDFPEFSVVRIVLDPNIERLDHPEGEGEYRLLYVVSGTGKLSSKSGEVVALEKEDGFLLPAIFRNYTISAKSKLTLLVAYPKHSETEKD